MKLYISMNRDSSHLLLAYYVFINAELEEHIDCEPILTKRNVQLHTFIGKKVCLQRCIQDKDEGRFFYAVDEW